VSGGWRKLHNEELPNYTLLPVLIEWSSQEGWDRQGRQHEWGRKGMLIGYWWKSQKERDH
jgi:hypothetical protein